jgi:hypothetical protein
VAIKAVLGSDDWRARLRSNSPEVRVIVFDKYVEFADMANKEIQKLAFVSDLPPRQHQLIGAFRVELKSI